MGEWKGVITNAGFSAVVSSLATGNAITLDAVKVGTGTVPDDEMRTATALKTQVGSGVLKSKVATEDGIRIVSEIVPLSSAYTIKEVGIFATYDGTTFMMALYQNTDGVEIPASSAFLDYKYRLFSDWPVDNEAEILINDNTPTKINVYQGTENAGKYLIVGEDGMVTPVTVPFAEGDDF